MSTGTLRRGSRRLLADERGETGIIEMLMWLPVIVILLGTMGVALRQNTTAGIAQDAAEAAARQARSGVDPGDGRRLAEASLARSFDSGACTGTIDTSRWDAGMATISVTCTTEFTGLSYVSPGPYEVTRTWTETVDAARIARTGP
jgi:hypothetical protein